MSFKVYVGQGAVCVCDVCGDEARAESWAAGPPDRVARYHVAPTGWRGQIVRKGDAWIEQHICPKDQKEMTQ